MKRSHGAVYGAAAEEDEICGLTLIDVERVVKGRQIRLWEKEEEEKERRLSINNN